MPLAQLPSPDCLKSLGESREVCTPIQGLQLIFNPHWGTFTFKTVSLAGGKNTLHTEPVCQAVLSPRLINSGAEHLVI